VLAEGFKSERLPRVEVYRGAVGGPFLCARDRGVVAVLDPRSGSKGYARRALLGLVPSDFTMSLGDVGKFLEPR
jgi:hypothetical protein